MNTALITPVTGATLPAGTVLTDADGRVWLTTVESEPTFLQSDSIAAWTAARELTGITLRPAFYSYLYGIEVHPDASTVASTVRQLADMPSDAGTDWASMYRSAVNEHETFKSRVVEVGLDYAQRNNFCGEYDRCMAELGLPGRDRDFAVPVTIEHTFYVTVTAADCDTARELVEDMAWSTLRPQFADAALYSVDSLDVSTPDES